MEIQKFLNRIQYEGGHTPNLENLSRLVRSHLETVPFENLDFYNNPKELSLKLEDVYNKVVVRNRGGVCFELNGLLHWALRELGYDRYPVSVRILMFGDESAPITHQGNIVVLDGQKYYCDVGFGGPGPKGVLHLDDRDIQRIDGDCFQVTKEGVQYHVFREHNGQWMPLLIFADIPSDVRDFEILLYYFTVNPASYFVTQRIVNLCTPKGSLALTNSTFTKRENESVVRRELVSEQEVAQILESEFGLILQNYSL